MNVKWTFVLGGTIVAVNSLVALADLLQGGVMWPCLLIAIGGQAVGLVGLLR